MNRRTFLRVLGFGAIAAPLTKPLALYAIRPVMPSVGGITHATYPFWRNTRFLGDEEKIALVKRLMDNALDEHRQLLNRALFQSDYFCIFQNRAAFSLERPSAVYAPSSDR